jgi:hypothetical protein
MHSEMLFSVYWQAREPRLLTLAYKHNMKTFTKNKTVQETKLEFGQSQLDASLPWHSLKLSAAIINRRPWFLSSDTSNQILTQTHLLKPIQCALKCCSRSVCKLESLDRFNFTRRWLSEQYTWRRFAKRKQNGTIHRQMWNWTEPTKLRCTSVAVFGTLSLSLSAMTINLQPYLLTGWTDVWGWNCYAFQDGTARWGPLPDPLRKPGKLPTRLGASGQAP